MVKPFRVEPEAAGYLSPALDLLREACGEAGIEFFVVGAAARDLLLEHVYGVHPFRSTGDVDIAVAVDGWPEYDELIERLVVDYEFSRTQVGHRVKRPGLVVDVVPFGEIASDDREVEWPTTEWTMSVLGYPEAFESAVGIQIGDAAPIRVASLPGIVVLKMVAWSEASHRRRQDPIDICAIMMSYDKVADETLYTEHDDLLDGLNDMRVAYARILGRDVAALLVEPALRSLVTGLLQSNTEDDYESLFVQAMGRECHPDFAYRLRCLRALREGVEERLAATGSAPSGLPPPPDVS